MQGTLAATTLFCLMLRLFIRLLLTSAEWGQRSQAGQGSTSKTRQLGTAAGDHMAACRFERNCAHSRHGTAEHHAPPQPEHSSPELLLSTAEQVSCKGQASQHVCGCLCPAPLKGQLLADALHL